MAAGFPATPWREDGAFTHQGEGDVLRCSPRFAACLTVLPVLLLAASAAGAQGLTPAEQETFTTVSRAGETVARAGDRTALILASTQLSTAADEALSALGVADGARENAVAAYRAAARAAQASMVTCANGYACTGNRLDPFEGIARASRSTFSASPRCHSPTPPMPRWSGLAEPRRRASAAAACGSSRSAWVVSRQPRRRIAGTPCSATCARRSRRTTRCTRGRPRRPQRRGATCSTTSSRWWKRLPRRQPVRGSILPRAR